MCCSSHKSRKQTQKPTLPVLSLIDEPKKSITMLSAFDRSTPDSCKNQCSMLDELPSCHINKNMRLEHHVAATSFTPHLKFLSPHRTPPNYKVQIAMNLYEII